MDLGLDVASLLSFRKLRKFTAHVLYYLCLFSASKFNEQEHFYYSKLNAQVHFYYSSHCNVDMGSDPFDPFSSPWDQYGNIVHQAWVNKIDLYQYRELSTNVGIVVDLSEFSTG